MHSLEKFSFYGIFSIGVFVQFSILMRSIQIGYYLYLMDSFTLSLYIFLRHSDIIGIVLFWGLVPIAWFFDYAFLLLLTILLSSLAIYEFVLTKKCPRCALLFKYKENYWVKYFSRCPECKYQESRCKLCYQTIYFKSNHLCIFCETFSMRNWMISPATFCEIRLIRLSNDKIYTECENCLVPILRGYDYYDFPDLYTIKILHQHITYDINICSNCFGKANKTMTQYFILRKRYLQKLYEKTYVKQLAQKILYSSRFNEINYKYFVSQKKLEVYVKDK